MASGLLIEALGAGPLQHLPCPGGLLPCLLHFWWLGPSSAWACLAWARIEVALPSEGPSPER